MKIFITGIAGFLGSHLAEKLVSLGHSVSGIDNLIGGYRDNVPLGAVFHQLDCGELHRNSALLDGVDVVVHSACTAYEGLSVFSPNFVVQNTMQITASVLSATTQAAVKKFVFCSSMARYGRGDLPFVETANCSPEDPYGIAKYASELLVRNMANTHGFDYAIAVPHNIIGPKQKYDDPYRNVASIMINRMLQDKQPIIYGDGEQIRCFSFIDDCVYCLTEMVINERTNGLVINIGPDTGFISINTLAAELASLLCFDLNPIYVPARPQEVKVAYCSSKLAREILGYKEDTDLQIGLQSLINYIKDRGTRPFQYFLPLEINNDRTPVTWKNQSI
jgi:UDP-glucose 4-epimerase